MMPGREDRKRRAEAAGHRGDDPQHKHSRRLPQGGNEERGEEEEEEEEEEEFPEGVECEEEYDEEDVYVMVQMPSSVDSQALLSAASVTMQGVGTSTPQIKVGEDVYHGKTEPIVGTTMAFVTPKAGSSGRKPLELMCFSTMRMAFSQPPAARKDKRAK